MLLRLAYLGVTNAFAMPRLLPMSDRDKDVEILALRHQITVLERQLGKNRVRFIPNDRRLGRLRLGLQAAPKGVADMPTELSTKSRRHCFDQPPGEAMSAPSFGCGDENDDGRLRFRSALGSSNSGPMWCAVLRLPSCLLLDC
ncbi:hypothetical protein [Saccharopolyspora shandongensis]|uniref:hypothetical protein n=1 Tax=Saccharopolyspora shandongensis TaxID=418495 RepID=UPI0033C65D01